MKSTELRIGNYVYGVSDRIEMVIGINSNGAIITSKINTVLDGWIEDVSPIPLTPEILEQCGFVKDDLGYKSLIQLFSLYYYHPTGKGNYRPAWNENICGEDFKYLHQLQNIFHDLTGQELTYTPLKEIKK